MGEGICYLLIQYKAGHKTRHMFRPVFSVCAHTPIPSSFRFCHS